MILEREEALPNSRSFKPEQNLSSNVTNVHTRSFETNLEQKRSAMANNLHQAQSHEVLRSWQCQRSDINHHMDFVLPIFIGNNDDAIEPIGAMPNVNRYGVNTAIKYLEPLVYSYGLRAVLLFPVVTKPDPEKVAAGQIDDEDDDDMDDRSSSGREINSSLNSSGTTSTSTSSSSEADAGEVMPQRFLSASDALKNSQITNPQNPFLDQGEEEDHLLGSEGSRKPSTLGEGLQKSKTKAVDIKLIRSLALKDKHNPVLRLLPLLRAKFPDLLILCDVCLCAFTSTGHCCLFEDHERHPTDKNNFPISNKITCQYLATLAVKYALKGCNVIAPSDMMDGRIKAIRDKLDESDLNQVPIMSYSAKFASAFYGPFRDATKNTPEFGDRRAYQLPAGSRAMAMRAVQRDVDEGADMIMVKPGGSYLDIIRDIRESHPSIPIAVYQVSGEYTMLKIAADAGVLDLKKAVNESMTAFRRAGATIIISYFTPEILRGEI